MILPVIAYGDPVLRAECEEVEEGTDMTSVLKDMRDTMHQASGVGLAAPQVGKSIRLFIVDASVLPVLPTKPYTLTIMANADRIGKYISTGEVLLLIY